MQANFGVLEKRRDPGAVHRRHQQQTRELLAEGPLDLVVWPETVYSRGVSGPFPVAGDLIRGDHGTPLLFGAAGTGLIAPWFDLAIFHAPGYQAAATGWHGAQQGALAAMLLGGAYLLRVDTLARTMARIEVPIGILTAVLGAPFFLWLLMRGREGWS